MTTRKTTKKGCGCAANKKAPVRIVGFYGTMSHKDMMAMSQKEVDELSNLLEHYRKVGKQTEIWGKDHWKNPFVTIVDEKQLDQLRRAIIFFLADNPKVEKISSHSYKLTTKGYSA